MEKASSFKPPPILRSDDSEHPHGTQHHVVTTDNVKKSLSTIPEESKSGSTSYTAKSAKLTESDKSDRDVTLKAISLIFGDVQSKAERRERLRHLSQISTSSTYSGSRRSTQSLQEEMRLLSSRVCGAPLFQTVLEADIPNQSIPSASVLIASTKLRKISSVHNAIAEEGKMKEIYTAKPQLERLSFESISYPYLEKSPVVSGTDITTSTSYSDVTTEKKRLDYLLGIVSSRDKELGTKTDFDALSMDADKEAFSGTSSSMIKAQRYLRTHRIFEFFQFLIAHMLSASPSNPVEFLIEFLQKCLVYRSGFSEAPVLYGRKHLECLFNLMDRMKTGFIKKEQYKTGMITLGICSYNEHPPVTAKGLVAKDFFIEEAYESLVNLLNDMLRRRGGHDTLMTIPPPSTPEPSNLRLDVKLAPDSLRYIVNPDAGVRRFEDIHAAAGSSQTLDTPPQNV